ncbi:MAG: hypothetical protein J6U39_00935 [Clostridia bacterium]|nr:hypothetical protein [Clostridia bacterium]
MKVSFKDAKIIAEGRYHEKAAYDMASDSASVVADGCGGLSSYRVNNVAGDFIRTFLSLDLKAGGEPISPYLPKRVEMVGRTQRVTVFTKEGELSVTTFLSAPVNGVFLRIEAGFPFEFSVNYRGEGARSARHVSFLKGGRFMLSSSVPGDWIRENAAFYASSSGRADLLLSFAAKRTAHREAFRSFDAHYAATLAEIKGVEIPTSAETEEEKALYLSAYFTALENYKKVGAFGAFAAGVNYMDPLRTYFRDSYFTVLPLLRSRPDMVRSEILTLARGIKKDGSCPSAVKSDFTAFWGDHYDSPSFFVMEIFEYVKASKDRAVLQERIHGRTLLEIVRSVVERLIEKSDKRGLLYKEGKYNKRDWADEVNRNGYVTFVNLLFYCALIGASYLFEEEDAVLSTRYAFRAAYVKDLINARLFDEEKGYYVNYKTKAFTEDNLSVDTVFAILFGVAEGERAESLLDRMESLLETKNNAAQGGGDYGVMCVYPPYRVPRGTCHKSAHPYDYHNGANWCYLTAMYAYAKLLRGRDWRSPILSTFRYYVTRGQYTPVEYFSPSCEWGSSLQGWSAALALVYQRADRSKKK